MLDNAWLKALPVPTPEQTARFADHVADNHSWYKHLPFFPPGALFVFFPNPSAGRGVITDGTWFMVAEVVKGDYFLHHSRLPTAEYRARFGHWDYWVHDNPRVPDPKSGPWVNPADGNSRELLTDDLKEQWSCRLTAFLKPAPPMFSLQADKLEREAEAFVANARTHSGNAAVARYHAVVEKLRVAGNWTWLPFMDSEMREQRQVLLDTLNRVREAWAECELDWTVKRRNMTDAGS